MFFEAKRQNAGICGTCQEMFAIWTFISTGRRVTQVSKCVFYLRVEAFSLQPGWKKQIRNLWFSIIPGKNPPSMSFLFSKLQCQSAFGNAAAIDCNQATLWRHVQLEAPRMPSPPTHHPTMHIRQHLQYVNNGNMFRNVNGRQWSTRQERWYAPPPPHPSDEHTTACATCLTWVMYSSGTLMHPHPAYEHTTACATF